MNQFVLPTRELAGWLVPLAAVVVVLGIEVDWGHRVVAPVAVGAPPAPKPVEPALLPEYEIPGGVDARSETVNRTLFNPTRRPAPALAQEAPKPTMQRGQFALTGTTVTEGKSTAFLRDVKTGKFHRVQQGDSINGVRVAEVKPDRVKLTMGDDSEELVLKVAVNAKPTPAVPAAVAAVPGLPGQAMPGQPIPGQPIMPGQTLAGQTPEQAAQTLLERRRAARAAAAAAAGVNPDGVPPAGSMSATPPPQGVPVPAPNQPMQGQATWNDMFRAYQQRATR